MAINKRQKNIQKVALLAGAAILGNEILKGSETNRSANVDPSILGAGNTVSSNTTNATEVAKLLKGDAAFMASIRSGLPSGKDGKDGNAAFVVSNGTPKSLALTAFKTTVKKGEPRCLYMVEFIYVHPAQGPAPAGVDRVTAILQVTEAGVISYVNGFSYKGPLQVVAGFVDDVLHIAATLTASGATIWATCVKAGGGNVIAEIVENPTWDVDTKVTYTALKA